MKIYFDENTFPQLAHGLRLLQEPLNARDSESVEVIYLPDEFGKGAKDEEWIPRLGAIGAVIITQDLSIHRTRSQRELYETHGLGAFFSRRHLKKAASGTGILCNKSSKNGKKSNGYRHQNPNARSPIAIRLEAIKQIR